MSWAMLNRSISSMAGQASGGTYDVQEYFWGAELSKDKPTFKWNPDAEMDDEFSDTSSILFLKRAVLGMKAVQGERNIVEAHCTSMDEDEQKHPILSLTLGLEDHCDVELSFKHMDEVSFTLVAGSGPVHLVGQHYLETNREAGMDDTDMDEAEDEDELGVVEEEDEEEEEKPVGKKRKVPDEDGPDSKKAKGTKGAAANGKANGTANGTANVTANGAVNGKAKTPKKAKA